MVGHDLAALNTNTNTAMSEINSQRQERQTVHRSRAADNKQLCPSEILTVINSINKHNKHTGCGHFNTLAETVLTTLIARTS